MHLSRSLRGNVDRNISTAVTVLSFSGRSLRGNVDRNMFNVSFPESATQVVPYVGTWIEMSTNAEAGIATITVVPYVGTWIEIATC